MPPPPSPPDPLSRRLLIVTGKGGVGKTSVAAALGLLGARQGLRTLVVEIDGTGTLGRLLGAPMDRPGIHEIGERLHTANLDPDTVARDFMITHLHFKALYEKILQSRVWAYFYAAAPGLRELLALGKIQRLEERTSFRRSERIYDRIIVDAPATGHGVGLLNVPRVATRILVGPLRKQSQRMAATLADPTRTGLVLVTLPEELPVNETIELYREAIRQGFPPSLLVVNEVLDAVQDKASGAALSEMMTDDGIRTAVREVLGTNAARAARACAERARVRSRRATAHLARLKREVPLPKRLLPCLPRDTWDRDALEVLVDHLLHTERLR